MKDKIDRLSYLIGELRNEHNWNGSGDWIGELYSYSDHRAIHEEMEEIIFCMSLALEE